MFRYCTQHTHAAALARSVPCSPSAQQLDSGGLTPRCRCCCSCFFCRCFLGVGAMKMIRDLSSCQGLRYQYSGTSTDTSGQFRTAHSRRHLEAEIATSRKRVAGQHVWKTPPSFIRPVLWSHVPVMCVLREYCAVYIWQVAELVVRVGETEHHKVMRPFCSNPSSVKHVLAV